MEAGNLIIAKSVNKARDCCLPSSTLVMKTKIGEGF